MQQDNLSTAINSAHRSGYKSVKFWFLIGFMAIIAGIGTGYATWTIVREQPDGSAIVRLSES